MKKYKYVILSIIVIFLPFVYHVYIGPTLEVHRSIKCSDSFRYITVIARYLDSLLPEKLPVKIEDLATDEEFHKFLEDVPIYRNPEIVVFDKLTGRPFIYRLVKEDDKIIDWILLSPGPDKKIDSDIEKSRLVQFDPKHYIAGDWVYTMNISPFGESYGSSSWSDGPPREGEWERTKQGWKRIETPQKEDSKE